MPKTIGILTAGGDCPGLNAVIRAVGKTLAASSHRLLGFKDGFDGIAFDRTMPLGENDFSGLLTLGGTILHTSRNKPHKMPVGKEILDMTNAIVDNYHKHQLSCLICIGGGGTHKNALRLKNQGLNIVTLPKTIDNDLSGTDITVGFHTAVDTVTRAIDNLHSTASSHKRIMLVEIMGHRTGWLALAGGIAGGGDVILIPEIPYKPEMVAETIKHRSRSGKLFSIVPIAEGVYPLDAQIAFANATARKAAANNKQKKEAAKQELMQLHEKYTHKTVELARQLEQITGLETRVTILGHLQRGGTPTPYDRLLATRLGTACVDCILQEQFGVMIAVRGEKLMPVPLDEIAGKLKSVPINHDWISCARKTGITFGD